MFFIVWAILMNFWAEVRITRYSEKAGKLTRREFVR
jgi:hypothetical protein